MPVTTLQNCNKVMAQVMNKGFKEQIGFYELKPIIKETLGLRDDTVKRYFSELLAFGFLEKKNEMVFLIKRTKILPNEEE